MVHRSWCIEIQVDALDQQTILQAYFADTTRSIVDAIRPCTRCLKQLV